ncbi:LLM class flavin-dependent oxidoreductase [Streptomyces rugosispiralis]|uniref:LLM class flavin-dependent oxidoreductase n=1 Tax=Streptomyces rugosispiralis TaxID=2967341 RepID=A0ABT1UPF7_9ACTN|nr:LLM class flavin-dependent oxidoreductase [Streptomyces rugosispiralis]MCQ8187015.1 LLM class flavin-dependent oxidoreductase [Streptomyces rugosispiralis]
MTTRGGTIGVLIPRDIPAGDIVAFAQRAESHGFDELWVVEDLGYRGGLAQAATVLATTTRIRVGVGLLPAAARNVAFTAMEIATLAQLHPGRIDITVGHGMPHWMRGVGAWPASPLTLLAEYITVLKRLLSGQLVHHDGQYVRIDGLRLDAGALPTRVPAILAGVRGPRSLAVSGEVADGTLLAEPVTPAYVRQALAHIAPGRPHRLVAYNIAAVDDDPTAALMAVRPALAVVGEPDWRPHITPLPFHDELVALRSRCDSQREFARSLPDEWVRQLAVAGTPSQARSQLTDLFDAGVSSAVLTPMGADYLASLNSLAAVL